MLANQELQVYSFWEELGLTSTIGFRKVCNTFDKLMQSTYKEQVVERSSAIIGDAREGKEGIHGNHKTMTKFPSVQDPGYVKVSDVIYRFARDSANASSHRE